MPVLKMKICALYPRVREMFFASLDTDLGCSNYDELYKAAGKSLYGRVFQSQPIGIVWCSCSPRPRHPVRGKCESVPAFRPLLGSEPPRGRRYPGSICNRGVWLCRNEPGPYLQDPIIHELRRTAVMYSEWPYRMLKMKICTSSSVSLPETSRRYSRS